MIPGSFIVLMYHNLAPVSAGRYSIAIDRFREQITWLRDGGYTIDGFRELQQRLTRNDFPERYVVLTFDDGHKSNIAAAGILREFDAQATFFITKMICRTNAKFMDDHEIVELSKIFSVGSHGVTHLPLTRMNSDQIRSELRESKQWLEDLAGCDVDTLSAPGGALNPRVVRHALELGYRLVGNSVEWWNSGPDLVRNKVVNRVEIDASFSLAQYERIVRGELSYLLRRRVRSALLMIPKRFSNSHRDHIKQIKQMAATRDAERRES